MMEELAVNHPQSAERGNGPYNSHTRISGASANLPSIDIGLAIHLHSNR